MKKLTTLSIVLFALALAVAILPMEAFALDTAEGTPLASGLSAFVLNLAPILGAVLASLAGLVLTKLARKFHLEGILTHQAAVEKAAHQAAGMVTEYAAGQLKERNIKLTPSDKIDLAIGHVLQSVPRVKKETARAVVENVLARTFGEGATGQKTINDGR